MLTPASQRSCNDKHRRYCIVDRLTQQHGGLGFATGSSPLTTTGAKVFFVNSVTEANEVALKIACKVSKGCCYGGKTRRPWCPKTRIVCFHNSFHGAEHGRVERDVDGETPSAVSTADTWRRRRDVQRLWCLTELVSDRPACLHRSRSRRPTGNPPRSVSS
ncbi:hypothetical protein V8E55_011915 [Tylopilus felleus]